MLIKSSQEIDNKRVRYSKVTKLILTLGRTSKVILLPWHKGGLMDLRLSF